MDRGEREIDWDTLNGIASTLMSLAILAECLCVLPLSLRLLVLSLLRPAEAVARAFAVERAGGAVALPAQASRWAGGDSRAEALRLARSFRTLAFVFGRLQSVGRRLFRSGPDRLLVHGAPMVAWRDHSMKSRRAMLFCAAERIDTS